MPLASNAMRVFPKDVRSIAVLNVVTTSVQDASGSTLSAQTMVEPVHEQVVTSAVWCQLPRAFMSARDAIPLCASAVPGMGTYAYANTDPAPFPADHSKNSASLDASNRYSVRRAVRA